jgi:hypothetical protein
MSNQPNYTDKRLDHNQGGQNSQRPQRPDNIPEGKPDLTSLLAPLYRAMDTELASGTTAALMNTDNGVIFLRSLAKLIAEYDHTVDQLINYELNELQRRRTILYNYYQVMEYYLPLLPGELTPTEEPNNNKSKQNGKR